MRPSNLLAWRGRVLVGVAAVSLYWGAQVHAVGPDAPHTFESGTTISSAEVNENFATLYGWTETVDDWAAALDEPYLQSVAQGVCYDTPDEVVEAIETATHLGVGAPVPEEVWAGSGLLRVSNYGLLGTQGSFATSLAWNAYRVGTEGKFKLWGAEGGEGELIDRAAMIELGPSGIRFLARGDLTQDETFDLDQHLIITPDGRVGVGTTPASDVDMEIRSSDTTRLLVRDDPGLEGAGIAEVILDASPEETTPFWTLVAYGFDGSMRITQGSTSNTALAITPDRRVGIGGGTPADGFTLDVQGKIRGQSYEDSSRRYKEAIHPIADALDLVERLTGVRWQWIADGTDGIGFIAEEVAEVLPELVVHDAEGPAAMSYGQVTAVLVEAVKEQQRQLETQQQRLDDRDAEVHALRQQLAAVVARMDRLEAARER